MSKLIEAFHAFADTFKKPPIQKPVGYPSPANISGYVDDDTFDYAPIWRDRTRKMRLIREMRMGHVDTALLWHIPLICMTAAKPKVEIAQAPEQKEVYADETNQKLADLQDRYDEQAALVEWNFLEDPCGMRDSWAQMLFEMSLYLTDGFFLAELDWRNHPEKEIDGLPVRYLHWAHWRSPDTIAADGWKVDDLGELIGVQQDPGYGTNQKDQPGLMKAENILLLTHRRIGNNFEGESIYRPVHKNYDMQFYNEKTECVVNERFSGLLALEWDADKVQSDLRPSKDGKDYDIVVNGMTYSTMKNMLKNILVHKKNYVIPGPLRLRMVAPEGKIPDVGPAIERHKMAIMQSGILHFLTLGSTPHGSYSAGDLQEHPFNNFINSRLDYIYGKWNKAVVRKLIDSNWPKDESTLYPKMTAKFTREDLKVVSETFKNMIDAGYPADSETYKHFARLFGWPEPEDQPEEKKAKATVPGSTPGEGEPEEPPAETQMEFRDWKPYRKLRPEEEHVAFADIVKTLDSHREQLNKRLDKIRIKRMTWAKKKIAGMNREQLKEPEIIKADEIPFKDDYRKAAAGYLQNVINYGRQQVRNELKKLGRKIAAWEAMGEKFPWPKNLGPNILAADGHFVVQKDQYIFQEFTESEFLAYLGEQIERWASNWFIGSVLNNARQSIMAGDDPKDVAYAVFSALENASIKEREKEVGRYVNQAFGWGRESEFYNNRKVIKEARRSAVGDDNVCAHCRSMDGNTFEYPSEEYYADYLPDKDCQGGDACRCIHVIM